MLTVLPVLFAIIAIVALTTTTLVAYQRAWTKLARVRSDLREGGPFVNVRYTLNSPAWPQPVKSIAVRKPAAVRKTPRLSRPSVAAAKRKAA
ncbi:MAG: hypothetical protein ACKOPQ_09870 [Novosphingobium sp.]